MKTIKQLQEMKKEKGKLYDEISDNSEAYVEKEESLIILGTWVDFIDDLLDYNFIEFMDKNGYTEEDIEKTFFISDEAVEKEIFITEEQAKELLKHRQNLCKKHPYGTTRGSNNWKGIFIPKIELDILKWFLEEE